MIVSDDGQTVPIFQSDDDALRSATLDTLAKSLLPSAIPTSRLFECSKFRETHAQITGKVLDGISETGVSINDGTMAIYRDGSMAMVMQAVGNQKRTNLLVLVPSRLSPVPCPTCAANLAAATLGVVASGGSQARN
jgi:hypothetical protein